MKAPTLWAPQVIPSMAPEMPVVREALILSVALARAHDEHPLQKGLARAQSCNSCVAWRHASSKHCAEFCRTCMGGSHRHHLDSTSAATESLAAISTPPNMRCIAGASAAAKSHSSTGYTTAPGGHSCTEACMQQCFLHFFPVSVFPFHHFSFFQHGHDAARGCPATCTACVRSPCLACLSHRGSPVCVCNAVQRPHTQLASPAVQL
jgi:hypothetical protein